MSTLPTRSLRPLASSSRAFVAARSASTGGYNPHAAAPQDSRMDVIKSALYPANSASPNSASPVGARHAQAEQRLAHLIPSGEAHETVERAWALFRRHERERRAAVLGAKFAAMTDACDELERIAADAEARGDGSGRARYDRAMVRVNQAPAAQRAAAQGIAQGKKKTPESRFLEARVEGLIPREAWVPTETRGKGWNYAWTRPKNEW